MASSSSANSSHQAGTYQFWQDGQVEQQMEGISSVPAFMRVLDSNLSSPHNHMSMQAPEGEDSPALERASETAQFSFMSGLSNYMYDGNVTSEMVVPGMVSMARDTAKLGDASIRDRNFNNSYTLMPSFSRLQPHQQENASGSGDQLDLSRSGLAQGFGAVADVASPTAQQFYGSAGMGYGSSRHTGQDSGFDTPDTRFNYIGRQQHQHQGMMDDNTGSIISAGEGSRMTGGGENDGTRQLDWLDGSDHVSAQAVSATLYQLQEYRRREQLRAVRLPPASTQALEQARNGNLGGATADVSGLAGDARRRSSIQLQAEQYGTSVRAYNAREGIQAFTDVNNYNFSHAAGAAELMDHSLSAARHIGASCDIPMPETYSTQVAAQDIHNQDSSYNARAGAGAGSWNSLLSSSHLSASHGEHFAALYDANSASFYDSTAQGTYPSVPDLSVYASHAVPAAASAEALHGYLSHTDTHMQLYLGGYTAGGYADASGNEAVLGASGGNPDYRQSGAQHTYFNSALTHSPSNGAVQHLSSLEGTSSHHLGLATNMQATAYYPYTWRNESNELAFFPSRIEAAQESQGLGLGHYHHSVAEHMTAQFEQFQRRSAAAAASLNQQSSVEIRDDQGLLSSFGSSGADMGGGSGQSLSLSLFPQNAPQPPMNIHNSGRGLDTALLGGVNTDVMGIGASAEGRLSWQDPVSAADTLSLSRFRTSTGAADLRHSALDSTGPQQQQVFHPVDMEAAPTLGRFVTFRCKYSLAGRDLLLEICSPAAGKQASGKNDANEQEEGDGTSDEAGPSEPAPELTPEQRSQVDGKKTRLVAMIGDVDGHYRSYFDQMKVVMVTIDTAMGRSSSLPYTRLAHHAMSRHFRVLRDAIEGQLRMCNRLLREPYTPTNAAARGELPRLKYLDQQIRQQRAMQHLGVLQQHAWRPQRGLPEKAVILLRAWLFEHFLHPYPKDSDKISLAKKTGLTRSQVSNWFINARVRLWKPMVEEMYMEESREEEARANQQRPLALEAPSAQEGTAAGAPSLAEVAEEDDGAEGAAGFTRGGEKDDEECRRATKKRRGTNGPITPEALAVPMEGVTPVQADPAPFVGYTRFDPGSGGRLFGSGTRARQGGVSLTLGLRHADSASGGRSFQMASLDAALPDPGAGGEASQQNLGPFGG